MILVTGASGRNGRLIVQQLAARGLPVRAMVHTADRAAAFAGSGIEAVVADFSEPASLAAALDGVATAYLLTPTVPQQGAYETAFIEAARTAGVTHIVKHSALDAPQAVANNLALGWHGRSEAVLKASGLDWTMLQPHYFMQNLAGFIDDIRNKREIRAPMGDAAISMIDVHDIADVAVAVLANPAAHRGASYPLTGPRAVGFAELAERFSRKAGVPVNYRAVSAEEEHTLMTGFGWPQWLVDSMDEYYARYAGGLGLSATVTPWVERLAGHAPRDVADYIADCRALAD